MPTTPQKKILGYVTLARNMPMPTPCFLVLLRYATVSAQVLPTLRYPEKYIFNVENRSTGCYTETSNYRSPSVQQSWPFGIPTNHCLSPRNLFIFVIHIFFLDVSIQEICHLILKREALLVIQKISYIEVRLTILDGIGRWSFFQA